MHVRAKNVHVTKCSCNNEFCFVLSGLNVGLIRHKSAGGPERKPVGSSMAQQAAAYTGKALVREPYIAA